MSPEQARGETVDCRSDLFSLGSVLYTLCVGRPPFRAESAYGILRRITDNAPRPIREVNPDIPDWLCMIIARLMSKQASDRYQSAAEVAELFETCLAHVQQPTAVLLPTSLDIRSGGRRVHAMSRRTIRVIAIIAVLALSSWGMVLWQASTNDKPPPADQMANNPEAQGQPVDADGVMSWNDDTTEQIGDLQNSADVLEMQSQLHWDEPASTLLDQVKSESNPNSTQEIAP